MKSHYLTKEESHSLGEKIKTLRFALDRIYKKYNASGRGCGPGFCAKDYEQLMLLEDTIRKWTL